MPVARQYVQDNYKDSIGATPDLARFSAAMMFTPFVSVFSHPPDTIKTCLQGDVEQTTYKGYMQTTQVRRAAPATATTATAATAATAAACAVQRHSDLDEATVCPNSRDPRMWYACPSPEACASAETAMFARTARKVRRLGPWPTPLGNP